MPKFSDKEIWDGWDAILFGCVWALLLHPFIGLILGMMTVPKRNDHQKMSRGLAIFVSTVATLILLGVSLSSFHYQLEDLAPPGPIRELKANATPESIELTWLSSGDDGFEGAAETSLKYSDRRISGHDRAISGNQVHLQSSKVSGGKEMTQKLELAPSGKKRTFYFQINTVDDHGKSGPPGEVSVDVPASPEVLYENHGKDNWDGEGKWKSQDGIDLSFIGLGDCWACQFYEPGVNDSLTGPKVALPKEGPAEVVFRAYANLGEGDKVLLECSTDGSSWAPVATFEGWHKDIGIQKHSLGKWEGRQIQLRFRLVSDEKHEGRGFAFDDLAIRMRDSSEDEKSNPQDSTGNVKERQQEDNSRKSEDGSKPK